MKNLDQKTKQKTFLLLLVKLKAREKNSALKPCVLFCDGSGYHTDNDFKKCNSRNYHIN